MTTATPELHVEPQLPVLSCNFEQLRAWATGLTERYINMVVTEDALVEVKKDMADLNKNKAKLEEARKEVVRRVSEPIKSFEAQIKEVVGIFDAVYTSLSGQVKAFEDAQRNEKRKHVEGLIIEANMNAFGEPAFLDIPVQDKWLNKTTSVKAIREDIAAIIERHMEEQQRKKALEQARQDRAAAIENHVKALNLRHNMSQPVSRFLSGSALDISVPLSDVLLGIEEFFAREAAKPSGRFNGTSLNHSQVAQEAAPEKPVDAANTVTAPAQTRAMSIVLEYDTINEARVKACLETLKPMCVSFGARYR